MEDLLKKVSSYQLFNYLLAGAVFVTALAKTTSVHLNSDDAILSFFLYYFLGMVISRVGSLAIEPVLKLLRVIEFRPYQQYVQASALDAKLDILSQENNTYRTLITTFLAYLSVYVVDRYAAKWVNHHSGMCIVAAVAGLTVLFSLAYRKQTIYITRRIDTALQNQP